MLGDYRWQPLWVGARETVCQRCHHRWDDNHRGAKVGAPIPGYLQDIMLANDDSVQAVLVSGEPLAAQTQLSLAKKAAFATPKALLTSGRLIRSV